MDASCCSAEPIVLMRLLLLLLLPQLTMMIMIMIMMAYAISWRTGRSNDDGALAANDQSRIVFFSVNAMSVGFSVFAFFVSCVLACDFRLWLFLLLWLLLKWAFWGSFFPCSLKIWFQDNHGEAVWLNRTFPRDCWFSGELWSFITFC